LVIESLILTIQVSIYATLLNIPLAILFGLIITRYKSKSINLTLDVLISLPLVLPPVLSGYFLLVIFSPIGFAGAFLDRVLGVEIVFTKMAAVLACSIVSFPLMARAVIIAFDSVNRDLEKIARSLGAGYIRMFFTVTLRESKYGVIAGILLGFARSLGEFGATIIFAGNIQGISRTIPLAIFQSIQTGNDNDLSLLIFCSVGLGFLSVLINYFLINKSTRNNKG